MRICVSLEQIPELADLSAEQRRAVLLYFEYRQQSMPDFRFLEIGFVGLIVLAEIAGFIGGFVYWRSPFWGPLAGAMIGLILTMVLGYMINTFLTLPRFRRFLRGDEAQALIRMLNIPKEANAS